MLERNNVGLGLGEMSAPGRPQVLYLTAVDRLNGAADLSRETRIVVSVSARDFDLSLAIAGPIDHQGLQKLRDQFAPVRAAGGSPASSADQPAVAGLRRLAKARLGTDIVNARLQATIQRRTEGFDAIVVDDVLATPYLPANQDCSVHSLAHRFESQAQSGSWWQWLKQREQRALSQSEKGVLQSVSAVFAKPEVAGELLAQGLSLNQLNLIGTAPPSPCENWPLPIITFIFTVAVDSNCAAWAAAPLLSR